MLFLKEFDLFGQQIGLNFKRRRVYKTTFGGLTSLLSISFVTLFFYSQIISFMNKENVSSTSSKEYDVSIPTIALSKLQFMFAIKLDQTNADFLTNPLFNITWEVRNYNTTENGTKIKNSKPMQFEPCTLEHWKGLPSYGGIDWNSQFTKGGLASYLCPRITDAIELGGSYNTQYFNFLKVQVKPCVNSTDSTRLWQPACQTADQVKAYFQKTQSVTIMFRVNNYVINANDPKTPIKSYIEDSLYFPVQQSGVYQTADIYFTQNNMKTDSSLLPFQEIETNQLVLFNGGNFRIQQVIGSTSTTIADFFLRKDSITYTYTREFTKISSIAAQIGGFCQTFILIGAIFVHRYNSFLCTLELANKLYDFELGDQTIDPSNSDSANHKNNVLKQASPGKIQVEDKKDCLNYYKTEGQPQHQLQDVAPQLSNSHLQNTQTQKEETNKRKEEIKFFSNNKLLSVPAIKYNSKSLQKIEMSNTNHSNLQINSNAHFSPHQQQQAKSIVNRIRSKSGNNHQTNQQLEQISVLDDPISPETPQLKKNQGELVQPDNKKMKCLYLDVSPNQGKLQSPAKKGNVSELSISKDLKSQQNQAVNLPPRDHNMENKGVFSLSDISMTDFGEQTLSQKIQPPKGLTLNIESHRNVLQDKPLESAVSKLSNDPIATTTFRFFGSQTNFTNDEINRNSEKNALRHLQNEKEYLKTEFKQMVKRDHSLKLTYRYFLYKLSFGRFFKNPQVLLLEKAKNLMRQEMDLSIILNSIKEVQKLKDLLLDKDQQILFNFFPKPVISNEDKQNLPSRAEIDEKKNDLSKEMKKLDRQEANKHQVNQHQKTFNIDFKLASLVQKTSSKFIQILQKNKNQDKFSIEVLQRLHQAYQNKSTDKSNSMNSKLIEMLGEEMNKIFTASKQINARNQRILKKVLDNKQVSERIPKVPNDQSALQSLEVSIQQDASNHINYLNENPLHSNIINHLVMAQLDQTKQREEISEGTNGNLSFCKDFK